MNPVGSEPLRVDLARALDGDVRIDALELPRGATLGEALERARSLGLVDAAALELLVASIHGRRAAPDEALHPGDRIELTAGLTVDPKLARQRRVARRRAEDPRNKWIRDR